MKRFVGRLLDKIFDKFALSLLSRADERWLHPHRILLAQAQQEAADYAKTNMAEAIILKGQKQILEFAMTRIPNNGLILEFGVGGGESIRTIAARTARPVYGFDSFFGLPEDWGGRPEEKGHYSSNGAPPNAPAHVSFRVGLFIETLPAFLSSHAEPAAFIHLDADLYSSTSTVLGLLAPRIGAGTIIVFDEYFNYPSWRRHEFRAFQEFVADNAVTYRYIAWSYQQAAVEIVAIGEPK